MEAEGRGLVWLAAMFAVVATALIVCDVSWPSFSAYMTKHVVLAAFVTSGTVLLTTVFVVEELVRRREQRREQRRLLDSSVTATEEIAAAACEAISNFRSLLTPARPADTGQHNKFEVSRRRLESLGERWRMISLVRDDVRALYDDYDAILRLFDKFGGWLAAKHSEPDEPDRESVVVPVEWELERLLDKMGERFEQARAIKFARLAGGPVSTETFRDAVLSELEGAIDKRGRSTS